MTEPKTMQINDIEYVRKDAVDFAETKKQIIVLQRGWVVVGDVEKTEQEIKITNCSIIRVWGTSKGLGELAENGATSKTKLDPCPSIVVHPLSVVLYMNVNESNWK